MTLSKCLSGRQYLSVLACVLLTAIVSIYTMTSYIKGPLNGNFDHHLMQADRWGMPEAIKQHGVTPLYLDTWNSGWDGQFYYYIANDIFAQKDTPDHIDADAYRYQRVGIPILAKLLSTILFQDWVSPFIYYLTHFILILAGTAVAARFFISAGFPGYWIIPWSIGMGTQITLLNGLPDGAADALLIIAIIAAYQKKYLIYSIAASFACLSREAYIAFPVIFFAAQILEHWTNREARTSRKDFLYFLIPLFIFVGWHSFIRLHFEHTPAEQSAAVLGLPFKSLFDHLIPGLQGHYPNMPAGLDSYIAGVGIALFSLLIIWTLYIIRMARPVQAFKEGKTVLATASTFTFVLSMLYLCFGDTVMWNFTGYMKAAGFFLFCVPFIAALAGIKLNKLTFIMVSLLTIFFCWQGWLLRVNQLPVKYKFDSACHHLVFDSSNNCLEKFVWLGNELPGLIGVVEGNTRVAKASQTGAGFLSFGPYIELTKGRYKVTITYSGTGNTAGYSDITGIDKDNQVVTLNKQSISTGNDMTLESSFTLENTSIRNLEVRTWYESGELALQKLVIERL